MKKTGFLFILLLSFWNISIAQVSECGTKPGKVPLIFSKEKQDSVNAILAQSIPYSLRVFITVFANNDGSNRAASDADILRQFQNMVNQYQPQDICFSLINIKQVNNTDLNNQDADNEVIDLTPYMVSGCMNIFIHQTLFDSNGGLNGIAYAIPNTYLSLVGATVSSNSNLTTMGHELGHCLGLYHTFENYFGVENVTRNAASGCYNCNSAGDIICDTPADDPTNPNSNVDASCNYIGGRQDPCGVNYNPQTNNIMTYGNRACRNAFTNNQGTRMKTVLLITPSLNSLFSQDIAYVPSSVSSSILWNAGDSQQTARDHLILSNYAGDTYTVSGTAKHYIQSKKITMKPGTHFAPGAGGKVHVKVNPYCN